MRQEKDGLFHEVVLKQLDICKKKKFRHLLHIIHRNRSIQIADLNVKSKTKKILKEIQGDYVPKFEVDNHFFKDTESTNYKGKYW